MIYYTSDLHLGHANIIRYEDRPFKDVTEMDKVLINNWNSVVNQKDTVYILGDFSFYNAEDTEKILRRLHGKKHLILGNHDYFAHKERFNKNLFSSISDMKVIKDGDRNIVLCHYPIQCWYNRHHGYLHFYGHIHSNPIEHDIENSYNVGVDVQRYVPKTANEIIVNKINPTNDFEIYPHIVYTTIFMANNRIVAYEIGQRRKLWQDRTCQGLDWEEQIYKQNQTCLYHEIVVNNLNEHNEAFDLSNRWLHKFKWHNLVPNKEW